MVSERFGLALQSSDSFKHIVITRFWFRKSAVGRDSGPRPEPAWFEGRRDLFKTYCLPSVVGQSTQNFTWHIYFDECMPVEYLDEIRRLISPYPNFQVRTLKAYEASLIQQDLLADIKGKTNYLLTTRLDTDDGWHRNFVKWLQSSVGDGQREFLNFPVGIIAYKNRLYLYRHHSNAFISLLEPTENPLTVLCAPHEQLSRFAPIRQLDSWPAFLQVIHGQNLSNKPRGVRVHRALALQGFEAIPELFKQPILESDAAIIFENATMNMAWRTRDSILAFAKAILVKKRNN
jgi:hypothetical protein